MVLRALLALASVAVLSGCNTCTLIGCSDSLAVELGAAARQFGVDEPVTVTACIGEACVTEVVTKPSSGGFVGAAVRLDADGTLRCTFATTGAALDPRNVSLKLTKNDTVVLDEARTAVPFTRLSPNGESCSAVCQSATVALQ